MPVDISSVIDSVGSFGATASKAATNLFDLNLEDAVTFSEDADTQRQIGANNQIIESAKASAAFATQTARLKGATALGTDLTSQGEILTGLSESILDLMGKQAQASKVIASKRSVGLFDDPVQWVMNQLTIGDDLEKHAGITQQLKEAEDNMTALNQATQQTAATQNALTAPITEAAMKASSDNAAAAATLKANEASRAAIGANIKGITESLTVRKEVLNSQFQEITAKTTQEHTQIALRHLDLDLQKFDWQRDEKKILDASRSKETDLDNYLMDKVNDGLRRMGLSEIPQGSPRAGSIVSMIKSKAPGAEMYVEALDVANRAELTGGATILATTPADATRLLDKSYIHISPAQGPIASLLKQTSSELSNIAKTNPNFNPKDPVQVKDTFNTIATKLLETQNKKVVSGDPDNIFNIPPIAAIISASPEAQKLPVVQKVIAPIIAAGGDLSDPSKVFSVVANAMGDGKISYPEAIELTSLYQRGVSLNINTRNLQSFGLNLNPKKAGDPSLFSYNAPIRDSGYSETVDMTNPFTLGRALNRYLADKAVKQYMNTQMNVSP